MGDADSGEFVTSRDVFDEETEQRMDRDDLAKQRERMGLPAVSHPLNPEFPLTPAAQVLYDPAMSVREKFDRLTDVADRGDQDAIGALTSLHRSNPEAFDENRFEDRLSQALWTAGTRLREREHELLKAAATSTKKAPQKRLTEKALELHLCKFYDQADTAARTQAPYRSPNWQPNPGGVDLEVTWQRRDGSTRRVWAEVKWGVANLWNCAWDVAKMGLAAREGLCDDAYLIAGALHDTWTGVPVAGQEFLDNGEWDTARDVLGAHHNNWLLWKEEVKTRPVALPARITTQVRGGSRPITLADGSRWSIIITRVEAPGSGSIDVDHDRVGHPRAATWQALQ
ncbi:MAG: hypothetical protein ACJ762_11390 [Solirubrobacteraceae bacterium]